MHPYVEWLFAADPILASIEGDARGDTRLGAVDAAALAEQDRERAGWLAQAEAAPAPAAGSLDWLDHQVLLTELGSRCAVPRSSVQDLLVDRWSEDAAVARYLLRATLPDRETDFRVTDVWDFAAGGWRIVHHHAEQL